MHFIQLSNLDEATFPHRKKFKNSEKFYVNLFYCNESSKSIKFTF